MKFSKIILKLKLLQSIYNYLKKARYNLAFLKNMVSSNFSHTFKRYIFINNVVSYTLSSIILFLYLTFILIIGFYPNLFQIYLFNGSVTLGLHLDYSL